MFFLTRYFYMLYKVTKKFARGSESPVGNFKTLDEANKVIQEKLTEDAIHKVSASYCLYEGFDLIEEFDQSKLIQTGQSADQSSSSDLAGGKGSSQSFRPSPFSMTPAPKGMPRSWVQEDKEDKKDGDNKDKK